MPSFIFIEVKQIFLYLNILHKTILSYCIWNKYIRVKYPEDILSYEYFHRCKSFTILTDVIIALVVFLFLYQCLLSINKQNNGFSPNSISLKINPIIHQCIVKQLNFVMLRKKCSNKQSTRQQK